MRILRTRLPMIGCLFLVAGVASADIAIFDGKASAPFELFVGDKRGWATPAAESPTASASGYLTVGADAETGARTATWNGKGEAQLYLGSADAQDLSAAAGADAALVMLLNVLAPPKRAVTLRMGCGHPCAANADISKLLQALPQDQWLRVSVDLRCFVEGGLDVSKVDTPFLLLTREKMSIAIADVRLVDGVGPSATISCR